jgi:hypothetical protein
MVPGSPPLAVSSKTTIFINPERLPSPAYSSQSRLRQSRLRDGAERRHRPLQSLRSTSTAWDRREPRKARPEVALVTCSGGVGSPPDNTLTEQAPPDIAGWRGDLHGRRGLHPGAPFWGQASRNPSESGPDRLSPHRSLPAGCVTTNRDVSSTEKRYPDPHGSRTFCRGLVDPAAGEAVVPGRFRAATEPTRQTPRLRRLPGFQGRRSLSPAKGSAIGRTQGAFHQGSSPRG